MTDKAIDDRWIAIGSKSDWAAQAREDRYAFQVAKEMIRITPDDLEWVVEGLEPGDLAEVVDRFTEIRKRYQRGIATLDAAVAITRNLLVRVAA